MTWRWVWLFASLLVTLPNLQVAFCRNMGEVGLGHYLYGRDEHLLPNAIGWLRSAFERSPQKNVDIGLRLGLAYLLNHQSREGVAVFMLVRDGLSSRPRWSWHSPASRWQMTIEGVPLYEWVQYLRRQSPPELWLVQAFQAAEKGDYATSLIRYRAAFAMMPKTWSDQELEDYYKVLAHNISLSDGEMVSEILDHMSTSDYTKLKQVSSLFSMPISATVKLPTGESNDWKLTSLIYDTHALELGPLVPTRLVWRGIETHSTTVVQNVWLSNLIPNGGFEWSVPMDASFILGWEATTDQNNIAGRALDIWDTSMGPSYVASLRRHSTSYASLMVPVDPRQTYVLAFQSSARQQIASDPPATVDVRVLWLNYSGVLMGAPALLRETMSNGWRNWATVVQPPREARWAQVLLSLHLMQPGQGERELAYDNVLFAVLPPALNGSQ